MAEDKQSMGAMHMISRGNRVEWDLLRGAAHHFNASFDRRALSDLLLSSFSSVLSCLTFFHSADDSVAE